MHARTLLASVALSCVACTTAHDPVTTDITQHTTDPHIAPQSILAGMDGCFTGGGALVELGSVNNNDQHDHGALRTFGISPNGIVAAAGSDGTLKFWTMNATLVGVADPTILTYGPEIAAAPIDDLAFTDTLAVAGDVRGLVTQLGPTGERSVLGGTTPGVAINSVAFDRIARRVAHAQGPGASGTAVTPLVVSAVDGSMNAQITDTMATITDLAFTPDGALVVGGSDGTHATIELRGAADPTHVAASFTLPDGASVVEVAAAHEGPMIVAATPTAIYAISATATRAIGYADGFRSVDLTPSGDYALAVETSGRVTVWSTATGELTGSVIIPNTIGVRVDATGTRAVAGASDALLHVLGCH
jgi:WD40 repeat protein